jgi:predicted alpha-1,6-mannanase (GH76 family)
LPTRTHVFRNTAVVIVSLLTACVEIMFRPAQLAVDPVHADPDYRLYADAAMVALQDMYQPSTGQWDTALWWQQANILETTIDYTSQAHVTTYIDRIATTFNANKAHSFIINTYANTATNVDDQGILYEQNCEATESCGDDGPQFKGIFIKNLYYLYQSDHKQAYKDFILKNADAIWSHNRDHWNQLGLHWNGPFDRPRASSQSAAQDVLNAALNFF